MHLKKVCYLIIGICLLSTPINAACERGETLYNQAIKQNDLKRRIELLEQSLTVCRNFNAVYELGKAYQANNQLAKAELCFRDAQALNAADDLIARAAARQENVLEKMNQPIEARSCYYRSYRLHPYPQVLAKMRKLDEQRMRGVVESNEIRRFFLKGYKAHQVEPSLDLYINFEFDQAVLSSSGKAQADELGKTLADAAFQGRSFTLIGHTDKRGSDAYNLDLSERRAKRVKAYLSDHFGIDPARLKTIGKGERELLYQGDTEREHALNRRVAVKAE